MQRRKFTSGLVTLSGVWGFAAGAQAAAFSETDAASGVRTLLERGAVSAIGLLGKSDGFFGNPLVRIPLPGYLNDAAKLLKAVGQQ